MSCGEPHEMECSEVLDHLYEYLDQEMPDRDCAKFEEHFDECSPCLEKYGLEQEVKKLVKRCCGQDDVPSGLRAKVMSRIELIRAGDLGRDEGGAVRDARPTEAAQPPRTAPATPAAQADASRKHPA